MREECPSLDKRQMERHIHLLHWWVQELITQHTEVVIGKRENDRVCDLGLCFEGSVPLRGGERKSL